jgi:hypothetical protein
MATLEITSAKSNDKAPTLPGMALNWINGEWVNAEKRTKSSTSGIIVYLILR